MSNESPQLEQPYEILEIRRVDPPPGSEGANWHNYVIAQGPNVIDGYRQGSLKSVRLAVEEIVSQLNARRLGKRGRVQLVTTPKRTARR